MATDQGESDGGGDDPFEGLSLDDDFVNAAEVREQSADDRVERLQRIDREHRALAAERERERHHATHAGRRARLRRPSRRTASPAATGGHPWRVAIVVVALLSLIGYVTYVRQGGSRRGGLAAGVPSVLGGDGDAASGSVQLAGGQPPPGIEEAEAPRGTPADTATTGPHAFMATQPDGSGPVAYDPCRPIHYVINPANGPADGGNLVLAAVARVSAATGLQFVLDGSSDEVASDDRAAYQPDRYPARWAPVLITWSDPAASSRLAGNVAGFAGSGGVELPAGTVYLTGAMVLDAPQLSQIESEPGGAASVEAVIQHELGHLVGLAHVDDVTQVMNPVGSRDVTDYAAGDLQGLALLGQGRCFPEI